MLSEVATTASCLQSLLSRVIPISPPQLDSSKGPNRVNRAHWPTKGNRHLFDKFWIFSAHGEIAWDCPKWGREGFVLANPDLANILGNMDSDSRSFHFFP